MTLIRKSSTYYYGNDARRDYMTALHSMGKPIQIITLSPDNGHVCEEIPTCRKSAAYSLLFMRETVNLCADGYRRWSGG